MCVRLLILMCIAIHIYGLQKGKNTFFFFKVRICHVSPINKKKVPILKYTSSINCQE